MVAVVSGSSLGLFNSSGATLGGASTVGPGVPGRNGERIAVNAATGNLVVQDIDESVSALGLDLAVTRTYNSQGAVDGDNNDNWRIGVYQRLSNLTGIRNLTGTITKTFGDGTDVVYTYSNGKYVSSAGNGADDTLTWNGTTNQWTWIDGSGRNGETYDTNGRLLASFDAERDAGGNPVNRITYGYTGSLLTSITDASGQVTTLTYSGNNLTSIKVTQPASRGGAVQTLTRYVYDSSNRLTQVTVDLSPQDNSVADGKTYVTTYTYVGTTKQIASITQNGGASGNGVSSVSFTYVTQNLVSRLKTCTVNDGVTSRTTTFTYNGTYTTSSGTYSSVDVSDPLSRVTTYTHDTQGRLTSILSPTTGGSRIQTTYTYNGAGKVSTVTEDPAGLKRVTTNTYDGNDNLLTSRDSVGNTVIRTYDGNNQVLTETTYTGRSTSGTPTGAMTTHYIYDSESHLRFAISPDGRVTEHQYDVPGKLVLTRSFTGALYASTNFTEGALSAWANGQDPTKIERTDYGYDFRAQISSLTAWSGTAGSSTPSVTRFTYDQRGQLLNTTEARGESTTDTSDYVTSYTYDGLGRVLTATQWLAAGQTRTTSNQYDDVGNRTITTFNNTPTGTLTTTTTYNKAGELTGVVTSGPGIPSGTTTYKYDADNHLLMATDPTNLSSFAVYDEAGRKTGDIDAAGTLTEYVYNKVDQVVKTIRYATAVSSNALTALAGNTGVLLVASIRPASTATDQIGRLVYNNAGQVQYTIDPAGDVTETVYDGAGRVTDAIAYANPVTIASTVGEVLPGSFTITTDAVNDRRTRYFYGNDDQLLGTLDAAGYLTENLYNAAGELTQTISYANQTAANVRVTGTLAQLKNSAGTDNETTVDPEQDASTYFFYDGQGRAIGQLDAEGYFTETQYDVASHISQTLRYDPYSVNNATTKTRVVLTYVAGSTTFQSLKTAATGAAVVNTHSVSYQYDGVGRVSSQTTSQGIGASVDTMTTTYQYDNANNLISSTIAQGTNEARTAQARYNALGQVTQALSGEGSKALATLTNPTQAQIDDIWGKYGVKYGYDTAGREVSITTVAFDPSNNTTQTLTSFLYYDADSRVRFTVNAAGEVAENQYNTLGQLTNTLTYANRISTAGLSGGLLDASGSGKPNDPLKLMPVADTVHDAKVTVTYASTGQVASTVTKAGASSTYQYNAFGEVKLEIDRIDASHTRATKSFYDTRGQLTSVIVDPKTIVTANDNPTGFNLTTAETHDAFGRVNSMTDAMGRVSKVEYDRLGRTVATVDTLTNRRTMTYDAFDRVLTTRDALYSASNDTTTRYTYNDAARSVTIITPEGIQVSTVHNREGQTFSVTANGNTTTYGYNANGDITSVSDNLGALDSRAYDSSGRQVTDTDANSNLTRLSYDAANRVLSRTVDPSGLKLTTTYQYDGQGRVTQVTEPTGRITQTDYDSDGRVILVTVDPAGLKLRTQYTYDLESRVLTVVEGFGSASPNRTKYVYDVLGRRTDEYRDSASLGGTLNLHTQYKYDANGNVTRKIDANNQSTWYVYDNANRLTQTVDALGDLTELTYDAEDRVMAMRTYAHTVVTSAFNNADAITMRSVATDVLDRYSQTVYDKDGRAQYSVDALGDVVERTFDANGNVTRTREYAVRIAPGAYTTVLALQTSLAAAGNNPGLVSIYDQVNYAAYDLRGRLAFTVDATGGVTQVQHDGDGNVVSTTRYATAYSGATDLTSLTNWANGNAGNAQNATTRFWYDAAGRQRFALDGEGFLTETRYNDVAREVRAIVYNQHDANGVPVKPAIGAGATLAQVISAAAAVASPSQDETTIVVNDAAGRVSRVTDATGHATNYFYDDAAGNRQTITDANNYVTTNIFDAVGRLKTSLSPSGVLTSYNYDGVGNITSVTQSFANGSDARTTTYQYDAVGHKTRITDGEGFSTSIGYDPFGNQTSITTGQYLVDPNAVGFDAQKFLHAYNPLSSAFTYDALNQMRTMKDGEGNETDYDYDHFGNRTSMTEAANGTTNTAGGQSSTVARTTKYDYDLANRLVKVTTPLGGQTIYAYDALGNRRSVQQLQSADQDAFGNVLVNPQGNPLNAVWILNQFEYDHNGRQTAVIDSYRVRTQTYYDAAGNVIEVRFAKDSVDQRSVKTEYDRDNRKIADLDGYGNRTSYAYDNVGNRIKVTKPADARGYVAVAHYYFNADNQLTTVLDPTGAINTFKYDAAGNQTEARVYLTRYTGSITDTTAPVPTTSVLDRVTTRVFDKANHLSSQTASDGARTDYTLDGSGRTLLETQQANWPTSAQRYLRYSYDKDGRLILFTDVDGTQTAFTYDAVSNRTAQTITNSTDPNPKRRTIYAYDLNNRCVTEVFDPQGLDFVSGQVTATGLNLVKSTKFDLAGNVLSVSVNATVDAGTATDSYTYDLDNRQLTHTDGVGDVTHFHYNQVGDRDTVTDARTIITTYVYDLNNRVKQVIQPGTDVYTIAIGQAHNGASIPGNPTTTNTYDAAGNLVEVQDPNGNKVTRYYDGNGNVIAQLDGDGGLCKYSYNAAGELETKQDFLTRLTADAHNAAVVPTAAPNPDDRTTTYQYDLAGRLTQVNLPTTVVTTLTGTNGSTPTSSSAPANLTEQHHYNQYGDEDYTTDRAGKITYSYYDVMHRKIANIDPMGYLIEWDRDSQGNVLEQRVYMTAVANPASFDITATPGGLVQTTDRHYDTASRLIEEDAPATQDDANSVPGGEYSLITQRLVTRFAYDQSGHLKSKIIMPDVIPAGADSAPRLAEYYYYDGAGRKIGMVDKNRTLTQYSYDPDGNLTRTWHLYGSVPNVPDAGGLDLSTASLAAVVSAVAGSPDRAPQHDEVTDFVYDGVNRVITKIERLVFQATTGSNGQIIDGHTSDDIVTDYRYDADGNRTYLKTEDATAPNGGQVTQTDYDAAQHVIKAIAPDGTGTILEYDTVGNLIRSYTGIVPGSGAVPAKNVTAKIANGVVGIDCNVDAANQQAYVVYGTVSQANVADYKAWNYTGNLMLTISTDGTGAAHVDIPVIGTKYFFRVVTQDSAGNIAWTAEQSFTVPPRLISFQVQYSDSFSRVDGPPPAPVTLDGNSRMFVARFDGPVVNPQFLYGDVSGALNTTVSFVAEADGSYHAPAFAPHSKFFVVKWSDAAGNTYATNETSLQTLNDTIALANTTNQSAITVNGLSGYQITAAILIDSTVSARFTALQAQWRPAGSGQSYVTTTVPRTSVTTSNGSDTYTLNLGTTTPLSDGAYEIVISGLRPDGSTETIDLYTYTVGANNTGTLAQDALSLYQPAYLGSQRHFSAFRPFGNSSLPDNSVVSSDGRVIEHVPVLPNPGGDASATYHGFDTDYSDAATTYGVGQYAITTSPSAVHSRFVTAGDHTTGSGNMMVVNGSSVPNAKVWSQQIYTPTKNTNYNVSFWLMSAAQAAYDGGSRATLQVLINNVVVGTINAGVPGQWSQFSTTWNSTDNMYATVTIVDTNLDSGGNDFALDDMYFGVPAASGQVNSPNNLVINGDFSGADQGLHYDFYNVYWGNWSPDSNTITVTSSNPGSSSTNLTVTVALSASEAANMNADGLRLYVYNAIGTPQSLFFSSTATPGTYICTISGFPANLGFPVEVFYVDKQGHHVNLRGQALFGEIPYVYGSTAVASATIVDRSFTTISQDTGGVLRNTTSTNGVLTPNSTYVDGDYYIAGLDNTPPPLSYTNNPNHPGITTTYPIGALTLTTTGTVGFQTVNGLTAGYYFESKYDALNNKIASNESDGLYREFGYDKMGNVVETRLYGKGDVAHYGSYVKTDSNITDSVISTFATYDADNRKTADFGAWTQTPTGLQRAVTRYGYDALNDVTSKLTDASPSPWGFTYDIRGELVAQLDPHGKYTTFQYDVFGHQVKSVTPRGGATTNFYDSQGRLMVSRDAMGDMTGYQYDLFDRKIAQTDGRGMETGIVGDFTKTFAYDNRDRLISTTDAEGWHLANDTSSLYAAERARLGGGSNATMLALFTTTYTYDSRNNQVDVVHAPGTQYMSSTFTVYDALSRPIDVTVKDNANTLLFRTKRQYDAYGNLISETNGDNGVKSYAYGPFGRLTRDYDEDNNVVRHLYSDFGQDVEDYTSANVGAKDILKTFDDAGHVLTIVDKATGVSTAYTYDLLGNRKTEVITTPNNIANRNIGYSYDDMGRITSWTDSVTRTGEHFEYDDDGNRTRIYDDGVDPAANLGGTSNYHRLDHGYSFDLAERVTQETDKANGNAIIAAYTYDAASNRKTGNDNGDLWQYTFDANNRVVTALGTVKGVLNRQTWAYNPSGDIAEYDTNNGTDSTSTTYSYNGIDPDTAHTPLSGPVNIVTNSKNGHVESVTLTAHDPANRTTAMKVIQGDAVAIYTYAYYGDGREKSVTVSGTGAPTGKTLDYYDANKVRTQVNLGQGTGKSRPEIENFIADNEGHVLYKDHDDGNSAIHETTQYLYANGNPMGEFGRDVSGKGNVAFDSGAYSTLQTLGASYPGQNSTYTVRVGDTLQSIASSLYGNPSLWYVIADANHLDAMQALKEGVTLIIPNVVQSGTITAANHTVYNEAPIVRSTLPNIKVPPPPRASQCAQITAIIIAVVIAVVVSVVTYGVGSALSGAIVGAAGAVGAAADATSVAIGVGATAAVGAAAAAAGNAINQGIDIAIGADPFGNVPTRFDWRAVAFSGLGGAVSGLAAGLGSFGSAIGGGWGTALQVGGGVTRAGGSLATQLLSPQHRVNDVSAIVFGGLSAIPGGAGDVSRFLSPWVEFGELSARHDKFAYQPLLFGALPNAVGYGISAFAGSTSDASMNNREAENNANMATTGADYWLTRGKSADDLLDEAIGPRASIVDEANQEFGNWANRVVDTQVIGGGRALLADNGDTFGKRVDAAIEAGKRRAIEEKYTPDNPSTPRDESSDTPSSTWDAYIELQSKATDVGAYSNVESSTPDTEKNPAPRDTDAEAWDALAWDLYIARVTRPRPEELRRPIPKGADLIGPRAYADSMNGGYGRTAVRTLANIISNLVTNLTSVGKASADDSPSSIRADFAHGPTDGLGNSLGYRAHTKQEIDYVLHPDEQNIYDEMHDRDTLDRRPTWQLTSPAPLGGNAAMEARHLTGLPTLQANLNDDADLKAYFANIGLPFTAAIGNEPPTVPRDTFFGGLQFQSIDGALSPKTLSVKAAFDFGLSEAQLQDVIQRHRHNPWSDPANQRSSFTPLSKAPALENYRFSSKDAAVVAALRVAHELTGKNHREYGGLITMDRWDGSYSYVMTPGRATQVAFGASVDKVRPEDNLVAQFHAHPSSGSVGTEFRQTMMPDMNLYFSPGDIKAALLSNLNSYVVTPQGSYLHFNPETSAITRHLLYPQGINDYPLSGNFSTPSRWLDNANTVLNSQHEPPFGYREGDVVRVEDVLTPQEIQLMNQVRQHHLRPY